MNDKLFLLNTEFDDSALPGRRFYCKDCVTVEGLLASFPRNAAHLEVRRVAFPRPRSELVELVGDDKQELPCLVLDDGTAINEIQAILQALHTRHGFPEPHP